MADTTYVDGTTVILADSMNDLNRLHYTILGDPADVSAARRTLLAGMEKITNSLAADVALSNTSNFFTGPTIAQGTSGTWFAHGSVTLIDSAAAAGFVVKLWDGTTVIASAVGNAAAAGSRIVVSLSGYLATPAGNIRISVNDATATTGKIIFNASGESKDSTLSAIRIA